MGNLDRNISQYIGWKSTDTRLIPSWYSVNIFTSTWPRLYLCIDRQPTLWSSCSRFIWQLSIDCQFVWEHPLNLRNHSNTIQSLVWLLLSVAYILIYFYTILVLKAGLAKNFSNVEVEVVNCPDLREKPWTLAAPGMYIHWYLNYKFLKIKLIAFLN